MRPHMIDEAAYRARWRTLTREQRAAWQRLDGAVSPRQIVELITDVDGGPLGVDTRPNPNHGLYLLPEFMQSWNPNDDEPTTIQEDTDE